MSEEIIKILDDLGRRFGIAIDWSSENIMPYLQDLMSRFTSYEVITSIIWIVAAVIGIIGCSIGIFAINRHTNKVLEEDPYSEWTIGRGVFITVSIFLIIAAVFCIISESLDIITCYTIPEKMLFEYVNSLQLK